MNNKQFENEASFMRIAPESHEQINIEHKDFNVNPSEIKDINFFRYRKYATGRLIEYIKLTLPDGQETLLFGTTEKNQFISRLGLKISAIRRIYDYNERNNLVLEACKTRSEPLVFRSFKDGGNWKTYAVVTEVFTEVRHQELWSMVKQSIAVAGLQVVSEEEFRTTKRVWKTYLFENKLNCKSSLQVGDLVQVGLRIANSVKGTSSIIFYPFWKRLVCSNGMTSCKGIWKPATIHRGDKADIMQSVELTLKEAVDEAFGLESLVAKAVQINLPKQKMVQVLDIICRRKNLSQYAEFYMKRQIRESVQNENLWEFVNVLTWVSSHNDMSEQVKLKIEQTAHSLLVEGEQGINSLLAPSEPFLLIGSTQVIGSKASMENNLGDQLD